MAEPEAMATDAAIPASEVPVVTTETADTRKPYKSWRKKYRKIKARFDEVMKDNHDMFRDEQKLTMTAQRLQENNDQLLEILLDLNMSLSIPPALRINVKYHSNWMDRDRLDVYDCNKMLRQAYDEGELGRIPRSQFPQMKDNLEAHIAQRDATQHVDELAARYASVVNGVTDSQAIEDIANPISYLSTSHQEDYLNRLDNKLGEPLIGQPIRPPSPPSFVNMTAREVERQIEMQNPLSVHNWLRKHGHNLPEGEEKSDANASKKGNGRTLARKVGDKAVERARERDDESPRGSVIKSEGDEYEDEVIYEDGQSRGRKSKGGEDDGAYHPKAGGKGVKPKRKREDGDTASRAGSKKPKTSLGGASDAS